MTGNVGGGVGGGGGGGKGRREGKWDVGEVGGERGFGDVLVFRDTKK